MLQGLCVKTDNQVVITKSIFLNTAVFFISLGLLSIITLMFTGSDYISIAVVVVLFTSFIIASVAIVIALLRKEVGKKKYLLVSSTLISTIAITVIYQATS